LAVLLSWRRRSETPVAVLEGAFRLPLASRTKRLLAGLIDCSPLVLVTAYLVSTNTTMASEFVLTPKVVFTELVAIAVVVTHTCLSELIAGKTLGKAVFGLRVTDLTGKTAHPSRILLRNCFKAVDLLLLLPLVWLPLLPLVLGLSWFLSALGVYLRDIGQITGLVMSLLMFMSPIFYPVSAMPERWRFWLHFNPLTLIIEDTRRVLLEGVLPAALPLLVYLMAALALAFVGAAWFRATRKGFADVL